MSKYLFIVLVLLRFVAAASPCDGPCGPLNATIAACATSDITTCLCNNLQFTSNSQPCYNCYEEQGDTALASQIQSFLSLCPNAPSLSSAPAFTVLSTALTNTLSVGTPSVSTPSVNTPTGLATTTRAASSPTAATTTASGFSSDGSKRVVDYWKILGIVGVIMLGL
jgi:hypothetical protein